MSIHGILAPISTGLINQSMELELKQNHIPNENVVLTIIQ